MQNIIQLYTIDKLSLREIARLNNTDHHTIKRVLIKNWVPLSKDRKKRQLSDEHKKKIWEKSKWRKSRLWVKASEEQVRKNMIWHMNRWITIDNLRKYKDIEKLKFLNNVISRHRKHFDDKKYIEYLEKFYHTEPFCTIYDEWIKSWKCKWRMPSIDHLNPISKWWTFELNNLMFTTWFENRAKAEMTLNEWYLFKVDTGTESNLFYL